MTRARFLISLAVMAGFSMAGGALASLLVLRAPLARAQEAPGIVSATEIHLVDADGKRRASLNVAEGGEVLFSMMDAQQRPRVQLAAGAAKGSLGLLDERGTPRCTLSRTETDDRVTLAFADEAGEARTLCALTAAGDSLLSFQGRRGAKWLTLLAGPERASTLALQDPKSEQTVVTFAGQGQASLQLSDRKGNGAYQTSVLGDGRSLIALSSGGDTRLRAMLAGDGTPTLVFMNEDRQPTWEAGR